MSTDLLSKPPRRLGGPAAPIDPRLRARREEVARDHGRRRLRRLVVVAVVVALVVGAGFAVRSPLLDVDLVQVRGATHTSHAAALRATGIPRGRSMISVDPAAAEARLESLPWIARATVTRSWPGTVVVSVVERTPVAVVGHDAHRKLVDVDGRVLGPAVGSDAFPDVSGAALRTGSRLGRADRALLSVLADLPDSLRDEIARARTSRQGISLVLADGVAVRWGDASLTSRKAETLETLLEQAHRETIDTIDVSVPSAAALTRKAPPEP